MSATSSSTDPVQTVLDLLDGTAAGDWPGGTKPGPIEARWESSRDEKRQRDGPAAYAFSPERSEEEQFSADGKMKVQTEIVEVQVWSRSDSEAHDVASDAKAILEDYWNDRQNNTEWDRIRPDAVDDRRGDDTPETVMGRRTNQFIEAIRVELVATPSIGT